jgi:group I intron endonuclease
MYVGSTLNLRNRWYRHRLTLRRGDHPNPHLQRAWSKYGEAAFEISVLELADPADLLLAEQSWLDRLGCANRHVGFNIFDTAGSPGDALAKVWEGFVDPEGNEIVITNLFDFCRQRDLDFPSMHRLAMGKSKLKSYKGWTHKNSPRKREYVKTYTGFVAPDGQPAGPITNLAAFCREHALDNTHMVAVAKGRILSHRGWTWCIVRRDRMDVKTYTGFVNPEGERVQITNLQAFCRDHGLSPIHMHQIKSGQRKSHKGWTWSEEHDQP